MTENTHQMTSNPLPPAARVPGSVGVPAGADVRIVDAAGADVPAGETGEVAVRGPGLTPGYLHNDRANAESFFDGWFRTGDEGVLEDGYLRLRGRLKEMIIRGGENISPYEIEAVLQAHPQVAEAVVFGVDDRKYGQTVAAAVVLRGAVGAEELREEARRSLAAFKVPDRIHILEEIPKTPDREGAALAHGRTDRGGRRVRFAVLGAGAIGAYVGADARPQRRRRDPDRPRPPPAGDGGARSAGAEPARRLREPPGRHRRRRRCRRRGCRLRRPEGVQPARDGTGDRAAARTGRGLRLRPERHPLVVLPRARRPPGRPHPRKRRSRRGRDRGDRGRSRHRLRPLLRDRDRRPGRDPPHRGDAVLDRDTLGRGERAVSRDLGGIPGSGAEVPGRARPAPADLAEADRKRRLQPDHDADARDARGARADRRRRSRSYAG